MLRDVRVLDRTTGIAGPYCTKLLADGWADVVKVEPVDGDPLRRRGSGGLFEFLNASKRSIFDDDDARALVGAADILVVDTPVAPEPLWTSNPSLVVVAITPFGCDGPWAGRPATEFTLQAAAGSTGSRGLPDREPLAAGGRLGEWITGTYAALAAIAAWLTAERTGRGEFVDVAMLDCMAVTMATMPSVFSSFLGWPELRGTGRTIEVPSVEPAADGHVVFTTNSAQQYHDFCVMIGRPDLLDDASLARPLVRFIRRDEFEAAVHAYTTSRTVAELLDDAALFRIPSGPVLHGASIPTFPPFAERGVFGASPSGRFPQPRVPYTISDAPSRPFAPAPDAGADAATVRWEPRPMTPRADASLPLAGVRIVDCTAWWAGPAATEALCTLGADVVKVESTQRPDQMRFSSTRPPTDDGWWEWGPIFHGANAGKRGVTIDLTAAPGVELFHRLLRYADVLVENYTPRVMEQFGLEWEQVHAINPELIMVRMPAFGLDGTWRNHTGFAQTMECLTGMAWLTGMADGPPTLVRGACDPLAGMHAVIATMLALRERACAGGGRLVASTMVEAALNAAAEQVIEFAAAGTLLTRDGNRGPDAAPQGVYACAGVDAWVAVAVETDEQWAALCRVVGDPPADLPTASERRAAHDDVDKYITAWTQARSADDATATLAAAGVPAEVVISARDIVFNPQIVHRGLFEVVRHPVTGEHALAGLPFRFRSVASWLPGPAPTLGQHNAEVFAGVGLAADDIRSLEAAGVIGQGLRQAI